VLNAGVATSLPFLMPSHKTDLAAISAAASVRAVRGAVVQVSPKAASRCCLLHFGAFLQQATLAAGVAALVDAVVDCSLPTVTMSVAAAQTNLQLSCRCRSVDVADRAGPRAVGEVPSSHCSPPRPRRSPHLEVQVETPFLETAEREHEIGGVRVPFRVNSAISYKRPTCS